MRSRYLHYFGFTLFLLIVSTIAFAQGQNVIVEGIVKDSADAPISGAEIKLENSTRGFSRSIISDAQGHYQLTDVPPGTYQIQVNATGYQQAVASVTVTSDIRQVIDLGVDIRTNDINIVDNHTVNTNKEVSAVSTVVDSRHVQDLPVSVRRPYKFLRLLPGSVDTPSQLTGTGSVTQGRGGSVENFLSFSPFTLGGERDVPAVNGQRPISGNYQLDGVDNNNQTVAGYNTNLSIDAVQELRIATSNYSAEYGRNSGFINNIQTKSGSSEFHGSIFEFFNNDKLNANSFFAGFVQPGTQLFDEDDRDRIRRNQLGLTLSGPIFGNRKAFFFGSGEFLRERSSLINTVPVPTSEFIGSLPFGSPQSILLNTFRGPMPTFGFFSEPGTGIAQSGIGVAAITRHINRNDFSIRTDIVPNSTNRVVVRYAYDAYMEDAPQGQLLGPGFGYQGFGTKINNLNQNALVQWVHLASPNSFNDFTFGYNRSYFEAYQPLTRNSPLILAQTLAAAGIISSSATNFSLPELEDLVTGVSLPGLRTDLPLQTTENTFQFRDTYSKVMDHHSIKVGGEYRRVLIPSFFQAFSNGKLTFLGLDGASTNSFASGTPLYSQLLINPTDFFGSLDTYRTFRRNEASFFIQDDYKLSENLTLNLGLRYDYFGVISSKRPRGVGNLDSNFYLGEGTTDFFGNVAAGQFVPTNFAFGHRRDQLYDKDTNNFAPRLGFAYDFGGNGHTVIRGNYGVFYDRVPNRLLDNIRFNPPFSAIGLFTGGPVNGLNLPLVPGLIPGSTFTANGFAVDRRLHTPYVQEWFLGVQQALGGNTMLEINYIGNTGTDLLVSSDINRFDGSRFIGRPNPLASRVFLTEAATKSSYNALQISINRRFSNGLKANFTYTYSHSIDEISAPFSAINGGSFLQSEALTGPMSVRNFDLDRGSSDFDLRHRAILNMAYEFTAFKTQEGIVGHVLGGWQVNSIITLQSGKPFTIFSANDANGDLIFNDRAVYLGGDIKQGTFEDRNRRLEYLQSNLFVPSFGPNGGAMGRNLFTGPSYFNVDFALFKNTKLSENTNLQFRTEVFNLFNNVNFMNPSGNLSNPATFNLLTNTYNPRMIQLALRLQF